MKKKIVISGVNLIEGGILSVLTDCITSCEYLVKDKGFEVVLLLHNASLIDLKHRELFTIFEFPLIKTSWLKRLIFEYKTSKKLSKELKADLWISLHDITPNVVTKYQVVYCHNPSMFYRANIKDIYRDPKFFLFCFFYKYLYGINIKKNKFVIVQQQWIRDIFEKRYNVKAIVAYPSTAKSNYTSIIDRSTDKFIFFFPSFPRVFKNFEIIFEAAKYLSTKRDDFKILVTISGKENPYSRFIMNAYNKVENVEFLGKISRQQVFDIYEQAGCLLFPSKLETWGLPISEFKKYNKPILAADMPYAHETVGDYDKVKFFDVNNATDLSNYMNEVIDGKLNFEKNIVKQPEQPFFKNWDDLLQFLVTMSI